MKKLLLILVMFLLFFFVSCEATNPQEDNAKKLIINYYDGDTYITSQDYTDEIKLLEYPKEGYTFGGWYLDSDFSTPFDTNNVNDYFKMKSISLYAKMERDMKDFGINIKGKISETEYVVNPLFSWSNENYDSAFVVKLLRDGEVTQSGETEKDYYQFTRLLKADSEYEFVVTGKDSKYESRITFKTLKEYNNTTTTITLANPYTSGMVIQRGVENVIAGVGPISQLLTLIIEDERYYSVSDDKGYFEIKLPAREASFDGVTLTITNGVSSTKSLSDVLFGDVYLFSGQSNMQWPTKDADYTSNDINLLTNSPIRFFSQDVTTATEKQDSVKGGRWFKPDQFNCGGFSAIATITGALLADKLRREAPIGIITAYQGDTNIANWMGPEYYTGTCQTKYLHYNAMVYPLRFAKLSGVVWYQGCNNSASGCEYKDLLLSFFKNYRDLFNNENMPFFVIGLACYDGDSGNNFDFSYVRESQAKACSEDDNAYFISICDDGDPTYIHPKAKHYICERVEKSICSVVYDMDYFAEGPSYKSHTVDGNKVTIEFNNANGLHSNGEIKGLLLAGSDGKYHEATAKIEGNVLIASSSQVQNPVYIKYGFGKSPFVNIFNKDDFAITPFRTDVYNTNIDLFDYDSIDDYTFHPDGSKMEIALSNGNLKITKKADKGYGSIRLNKWGAIAYEPEGFSFTIVGTNSGAAISFRAIEGDSYEIWGYKIIDDFVGPKTFTCGIGDFICVYNKKNNQFEPQKIGYIELMVEAEGEVSFELSEARFIHMERSKPMNFMISNVSEGEEEVVITVSKALFSNSYKLIVNREDNTLVYQAEQAETTFRFDKPMLEIGKPYYISVTAKNELGETSASNSGYVFYLKDDSKVIVCNFDFKDQNALQAYIDSSMAVHNGLTCTLEENGVKINSSGQGWQNFIFKLDSGAGNGMTKLEFTADFSNYKGQIIMQLADTSYNTYNYTIDLSKQKSGNYVIEFKDFLKGNTPFTTQTLMWVMFNFNDTVGNGYILLDDVSLSK